MLKYIHTLNLNLLCSMFIHFMHILYSHYYEMQFECFDHFVISSAMLILPSQDTMSQSLCLTKTLDRTGNAYAGLLLAHASIHIF